MAEATATAKAETLRNSHRWVNRAKQEAEALAQAEARSKAQAKARAQARLAAAEEAERSTLREPADTAPLPVFLPEDEAPAPEPAPAGSREWRDRERPRPSQESASRMQSIGRSLGLQVDRLYGDDVDYYDPSDADRR